MSLLAYVRFFFGLVVHKWFVFRAGAWTGCSMWRRIKHDWSKLSPAEFFAYARQFRGPKDRPDDFATAWVHHQNTNDHHWEYWVPRSGHTRMAASDHNRSVPMPEAAVREMVADWLGAGRAYNGEWPDPNNWDWWKNNWGRISPYLHDKTVERLMMVLDEVKLEWKARHQ